MSIKIVEDWEPSCDVLDPELCEEGLNFLAYVIREDSAEGRAFDQLELASIRQVAAELVVGVAKWMGSVSRFRDHFEATRELETKTVRLFTALKTALSPRTSPKQLADAIQSVADLLRSSRRIDVGCRMADVN